MSTNPYAMLAQKKFKGDPSRLKRTAEHEPKRANDHEAKTKPAVKKGDAAAPAEKKREAKVISLKEEEAPASPPKPEEPAVPTKKEREAKDRHEDRSAKGHRERKEGQGVGGWDTDWNTTVKDGEAAARDAEGAAEGEAKDPISPVEKEKKEEEKPTITAEEYLKLRAEKNKPPPSNFEVRKVDTNTLKGLVQAKKNEEVLFKVNKPAPKPAAKPAAKPTAKPAAKKGEEKKVVEEPKEEKKEEKLGQDLLGFKYKSQQYASRGRGRGRSDEQTEGAEGERGRGRGRGRGRQAEEAHKDEANFTLDQNDFPTLG